MNVDQSSPARFSGVVANNVDVVSEQFTPPAGALLLIAVNAATPNNTNITIAVASPGGSNPVVVVEKNGAGTANRQGYAGFWTSIATGTPTTVSVRRTNNGGTNRISVKVYVVPGPTTIGRIGSTNSGRSTTNNLNGTYNSTSAGSLAFGCGTDGNALGAGTTPPTSTDVADAASYSGQLDAIAVVKSAETADAGSNVTLNMDAAGTGTAEWRWVTVEVNQWTQLITKSSRSGTFETPSVNVPASISSATVRLQIDPAQKALGPDITFTVYSLDGANNRSLLTSGTVNPGPWTDKFGNPKPFGADPEFGMTGIAGLKILMAVQTSLAINCTVLANTQA